jgi:maltose alpha-D-glucosyltransferase/alpha-amylase
MKLNRRPFLMLLIFGVLIISCKQEEKVNNVNAWYKRSLIYNLDVKTFKDSNGDGEGDFNGLISKLPYLRSLGISVIWLAPFQPSPLEDDGYDVTDYYGIDKKLGTMEDFKSFMSEARTMHIKVIMDLVLNHSSIKHPWFDTASHQVSSPRHDWYVWSPTKPKDWNKGMGFPGVEKETWRFDSAARQYFFHRFYNFQPDLNFQNPEVVREAERIMGYWLDLGMAGFRLDAVPFIIDDPRKDAANPINDFTILHTLTAYVNTHKPGAVLLGEANVKPEENKKYFGEHNDGLEMMFNFYANQYLFYGLATGNARLFKKALEETKPKPPAAQWAWFLRNHDEIDLGRLSKNQLQEVYEKMGSDTSMQLYKRGIRRRLAPMLGDDPQQLRMAYSLLYALPGTPVIRSGEEIGMGDDLKLKERLSVRTPMQWDSSSNGGFSVAKLLFRPVIGSVEYGYKKVNVLAEQKDPRSLLSFIVQTIRLRKSCPEIDNGQWQVLDSKSDQILAISYGEFGKQIIVCFNFGEKPAQVKLKLSTGAHRAETISGARGAQLTINNGELQINIGRYGYIWYRLK